jgi:hypothetical protein
MRIHPLRPHYHDLRADAVVDDRLVGPPTWSAVPHRIGR